MHHGAAMISLVDGILTRMGRSNSVFAAGRLTRQSVSNLQGAHVSARPILKGGAYHEA